MLFACPICREKLNIEPSRAVCPRGHSFDKSRFGYFNLLVGRGGAHGDNAEMVRARRAFLSGGFYSPLREAVADEVCLATAHCAPGATVIDEGCGEGYYTEAVCEKMNELGHFVGGFDISKDAVKLSAKRIPRGEFCVASAYSMPLADESVDAIYNVFSPLATEEVLRVLKPGGSFIMAIPAPWHLFSLKAKIYDTPYKNTVGDKALSGFTLIAEREIRFDISLPDENSVRDLFMMTPYAYRTSDVGRARVLALKNLDVEAHFLILHYKKACK